MHKSSISRFFLSDLGGGILLIAATLLALLFANTNLRESYQHLLSLPLHIGVGNLYLSKPLLLWINDGLMALFFLLVGLEIKRELLYGSLRERSQVALPAAAAIGGVIVPALIYAALNHHDPAALRGWAIPAATDIAFALGVLALVGKQLPPSLRIFVMTLAVLDDLAAVIIIALFYTDSLSTTALTWAGIFTAGLLLLNRLRYPHTGLYMVIGALLWVSVLKSGVHATLAGIVIALALPSRSPEGRENAASERVLHALHPWSVLFILPVFAFANAGVNLQGLTFSQLLEPVPLGIALGLFVGKQLGIFGAAFLMIKAGWARLPAHSNWWQLYGASVMCGIGFTMSLFISSLAFEHSGVSLALTDRLGILIGSLLSAVVGYSVLKLASKSQSTIAP